MHSLSTGHSPSLPTCSKMGPSFWELPKRSGLQCGTNRRLQTDLAEEVCAERNENLKTYQNIHCPMECDFGKSRQVREMLARAILEE